MSGFDGSARDIVATAVALEDLAVEIERGELPPEDMEVNCLILYRASQLLRNSAGQTNDQIVADWAKARRKLPVTQGPPEEPR